MRIVYTSHVRAHVNTLHINTDVYTRRVIKIQSIIFKKNFSVQNGRARDRVFVGLDPLADVAQIIKAVNSVLVLPLHATTRYNYYY